MKRQKTTVYIDGDLLTAVKVLAASTGRRDYEVLEDAVRAYMRRDEVTSSREQLRQLLDRVASPRDPTDAEALTVAYEELDAHRRPRRPARAR